MPTSNINLNVASGWVKLANSADADLLITWGTRAILEIATTSADTAPTVKGHQLTQDSALTRYAIGPGFVWARSLSDSCPGDVTTVVVSK